MKGLDMKYVFRGKSYTTLTSCYRDNTDQVTVGIGTVRTRLKNGWSLNKALLHPKQKTIKTKIATEFNVFDLLDGRSELVKAIS